MIQEATTTAMATEAPAPAVIHDPVWLNTEWGAVAVYGHELVSKKDLLNLQMCLNMEEFRQGVGGEDHRVRMVMFRGDDQPKGLYANCTVWANSIVINLNHTFIRSFEDAIDENVTSVFACWNRNMLMNYLHEIQHLNYNLSCTDYPPTQAQIDGEEKVAEAWATDHLIMLAKTTDIEPEHWTNCPFFLSSWREITKGDEADKVIVHQQWMLDNRVFFRNEPTENVKEVVIHNFKGYVQLVSGDSQDDESWAKNTIGLGAVAPLGEAIKDAKPMPAPAISNEAVAVAPSPEQVVNAGFQMGFMQAPVMEDGEECVTWEEDYDPPMATEGMGGMFGGMAQGMMGGFAPSPQPQPQFSNMAPNTVSFAPPTLNPFPPPMSMTAPAPQAFAPAPTPQPVVEAPIQKYAPTGITPAQMGEIMWGLYYKCYNHIFQHCGQLMNSDMAFNDARAVTRIPIQLTDIEAAVVMAADITDENGRWSSARPVSNGLLYGTIMSNTGLPAYVIYFNDNGFEKKRLLLPQNTAKRGSDGNFTKTALQARGGTKIVYVKADNQASLTGSIVDGVRRVSA